MLGLILEVGIFSMHEGKPDKMKKLPLERCAEHTAALLALLR